jgi:catechol 2,3-dioxygenase-like lactoylglutathione lyase family enzyme
MATSPITRRPGALGVHSVHRFVYSVPDVDEAARFYLAFGLDARRDGSRLDLHAFDHPHCWASLFATGRPKKLEYVSLGIFAEDRDEFRARIARLDAGAEPHPLAEPGGLWLRTPDGTPFELVVAPKVSPAEKSRAAVVPAPPPGMGAAPARSRTAPVRPRRLSHILLFSPDVPRMTRFCGEMFGMRLSDSSADVVAFCHGIHGSDHHLLAFAKSNAPGLHHSSWDVASIDEVGWGAETMRAAGYTQGWGVGRHVLGSNYFYYARDPWGSYAEFSFDIDFVAADVDWRSGDHAPEDTFYIWGPPVPEDFVVNHESPCPA